MPFGFAFLYSLYIISPTQVRLRPKIDESFETSLDTGKNKTEQASGQRGWGDGWSASTFYFLLAPTYMVHFGNVAPHPAPPCLRGSMSSCGRTGSTALPTGTAAGGAAHGGPSHPHSLRPWSPKPSLGVCGVFMGWGGLPGQKPAASSKATGVLATVRSCGGECHLKPLCPRKLVSGPRKQPAKETLWLKYAGEHISIGIPPAQALNIP